MISRALPALLCFIISTVLSAAVYQGNGIKIGEVTADSAAIWTRLTAAPEANWAGASFLEPTLDGNRAAVRAATDVAKESAFSSAAEKAAAKRPNAISAAELRRIVETADWRTQLAPGRTLADMQGALPGAAGEVRVVFTPANGGTAVDTGWAAVDGARDHTRQFTVRGLKAGTAYRVRVDSRESGGRTGASVDGAFRTAPAADAPVRVRFSVVTCGDYPRRDDPANGHQIYATMAAMDLDFLVHTGDVEYYDKPDPWATSAELARFKWNRIFAVPFQRNFHNRTAAYFTNDDHDLLKNDCWPGQTYGALTWEQGLAIWNEQTPASPLPYRTFRHGRDVQIWVIEGRRYRSANDDADGPAKTILGAAQKEWLLRTIAASDATFRVLITPTPIVGPDRDSKNDNHANAGFPHEGDQLRRFLGAQRNLVVATGDRHWQYFSIDPATGTREFGCGPSSDVHAGGYTPRPGDEAVQKFFRLKGGFLTFTSERNASAPRLAIRHHAVDGTVMHEATLTADGAFSAGVR
ncbi:MAG: alkaline phosphatase D family protein [Opitutaceae bacterium]